MKTLNDFVPCSLEQTKEIHLSKRVEFQYSFDLSLLQEILSNLKNDYRILKIDKILIHNYGSIYFDTINSAMYLMHASNINPKYTIRQRIYYDTGNMYFEIKRKNRNFIYKNRTKIKNRILWKEQKEMIEKYTIFKASSLEIKIYNYYSRIILCNLNNPHRITFDFSLSYLHNGEYKRLDNIVIAEAKIQHEEQECRFIELMEKMNIPTNNISKYKIGMLLIPNI